MNVTLLSGACIPIVIDYSSLSAVHIFSYICLFVYLSVLYAIVVITCVCQCNSIKKLDDDDL